MMNWQPDKNDEKDARGLAEFLPWQVTKQTARVNELGNDFYDKLRTKESVLNQLLQSKVAMQNPMVCAARE